jgi:hypothetical protein
MLQNMQGAKKTANRDSSACNSTVSSFMTVQGFNARQVENYSLDAGKEAVYIISFLVH